MAASDSSVDTGVLVIGAGPGGYVSAIRAGQLGHDVLLLDKEAYGGVCLNHGCIPSKALITASNLAYDAGHAEEIGITAELSVDLERMVGWKDDVIERLTTGVERLCKANKVDLMEGRGEFVDDHTVRVAKENSEETLVSFESAIIATGSQPIEIPGFSFADEPVLDSRQALAVTEIPDSIVIVGAGYIGMELATVYAKLGTAVTVVEMLDSAIPICEEDLTRPVTKRAGELGIEFYFGQAAKEWHHADEGITVVTENKDGDLSEYDAEKVLVAVGRHAVTDTLNLEAIGLEPDESGFLETDDYARTAVAHVYAVGDVAGEPLLAHKASHEGIVAAEVIDGQDTSLNHSVVPSAIFTDPEIGMVGLTESEAEEDGYTTLIGEFPFYSSGRALTTRHTDGFVRIIGDEDTGQIIGAQIVGPEASELVAELGLAIENELTLEQVSRTIHTHPTLGEAVMEAADNALGHAIHTLNR